MNRRQFITTGAGAVTALLTPAISRAAGRHDFRPVQLLYRGGQPVPYPSALRSLMRTIKLRSSIDADEDRIDLEPSRPELYYYPFIYCAGRSAFEPFSEDEVKRLAIYIKNGGTILFDDASGIDSSPFDASVKRELARILPDGKLERLDGEHTIFRSFFLLDRAGGRVLLTDALEGITIGDRTPVIYSRNDLGGAWATDLYDRPLEQCVPGGEKQRETALRLGLNIVMYALCLNYKKDRIHVETILKRRRLR